MHKDKTPVDAPDASSTGGQSGAEKSGTGTDGFKSEESKRAVLADLAEERKARQALQAELVELKPLREQMAKLAEVFGESPSGDGDAGVQVAEMVQQMRQELDSMTAEKARLEAAQRMASEKKLDATDIALLATLPDEAAMEAWADRLASTAPQTPFKPGTPSPGRSSGLGVGDSRGRATSVAQAAEDYRSRRGKKLQ